MGLSHSPSIVTNGIKLCLDASNPKSYSKNVHPNPTDAFVWANAGGAYQISMSRDTSIQSPVGPSPLKLVTSGTSGYLGTYNNSYFNLAPAVQGETWTFSFWVKGDSSFQASMMIFEATASGGYTNLSQIFYNVTPQWTRVSGSRTMTRSDTANVQVRIDCYVNGVTLWVDGLQVEKSDSASSFNPIPNLQASKIFDLSNNGNTGTLVNSVGYSGDNLGSLSFDGVNEYTSLSNPIYLNYNKTFIFWLKFSGNITGGHLLNINPTVDDYRNRITIFPDGLSVYNSSSATTIGFSFSTNILNSIKQIGILVDDSKIYLIEDGVISQETTINFPDGQRTYNHLGLQSSGSAVDFFTGNIYNFLHYNRALTASEIQQNFNALRGRFGV